jgi:hypothetical protein
MFIAEESERHSRPKERNVLPAALLPVGGVLGFYKHFVPPAPKNQYVEAPLLPNFKTGISR